MLILATGASMKSASAQGGVPVPKCGGDTVRDKNGNCVLTDAGREKYCQNTYGPYSHYDKSKKECIPREYCQANYGPGYQYDRSQNMCIKTTSSNEQSTQYGGYSSWDKYCKAKYGSNYGYVASKHQCVKGASGSYSGSSNKNNCAAPYISISATRWDIAVIEVDGIPYVQRTLTLTVSHGNHRVHIVGLNWSQEQVGEWGPRDGYVDYCKPWKITVS
jgi:hypothetical protein